MTRMFRLIAFLALTLASLMPPAARADAVQAMKTALDLAAGQQWDAALSTAPSGAGRDVILWQWLRTGEGRLGDYEDFLSRRPDWPGLPLLREKAEAAVARSDTPARVVAFFGDTAPATAEGAIALVHALIATGDSARAETEAMQAWATLGFTALEEEKLRVLMPQALQAADALRMETLLWEGRRAEALRLLPRLPENRAQLIKTRMALRADAPGVDTLLAAVPAAQQGDPGLMYERFIYRMRRDNYDGATELILQVAPDALGRPAEWAPRRALLARWLMRQGRPDEAYRVAAANGLSEGSAYADLEFLAGFIALRHLNDPARALPHFERLRAAVTTGISIARGEYWIGRADEAAGRMEQAEARYRLAAQHQTAFYGLLAAERLGLDLDAALVADTRPAEAWDSASFANSSVFLAGRLLAQAGDRALAKRFFLHLGQSQTVEGLAQLAQMAMEMDEPHIALVIAKEAAERGAILPFAYYPMPDLVPDQGLAVSRALALAIARRESEFDPAARSYADARGLMQVLPGTAKMMAAELEIDYEVGRLLTDPAYNARLGSAYLATLVAEFGPSIALVATGYNAGPGRPRRWISELGDPRDPAVDIVDWVETVPFEETRTYVMRVVEGVVIYRARLKGAGGPVRISAELRG